MQQKGSTMNLCVTVRCLSFKQNVIDMQSYMHVAALNTMLKLLDNAMNQK